MPLFEDFLKTITEEKLVQITEKANKKMEDYRNTSDSKGINSLSNQIAVMSMTMSIEFLRLYHEWLHTTTED